MDAFLPKGFQLVENFARNAEADEQEKRLSRVVGEMVDSFLIASELRADSKALSRLVVELREQAVKAYLKQVDSPSESTDDYVMTLLERAHYLENLQSSSAAATA